MIKVANKDRQISIDGNRYFLQAARPKTRLTYQRYEDHIELTAGGEKAHIPLVYGYREPEVAQPTRRQTPSHPLQAQFEALAPSAAQYLRGLSQSRTGSLQGKESIRCAHSPPVRKPGGRISSLRNGPWSTIRHWQVLPDDPPDPTRQPEDSRTGAEAAEATPHTGHHQQPEFQGWGQIFNSSSTAAAVLDRLLHHAHVLVLRGESYRVRSRLVPVVFSTLKVQARGCGQKPGPEFGPGGCPCSPSWSA